MTGARPGPRVAAITTLAAVSAGGALGAVARFALAEAIPYRDGFPLATFVTNVSGCLAIGALLVLVTEVRAAHRLTRPFLGTGLLGGFTTFSTYAVETERLLRDHPVTAAGYFAGTVLVALLAVQTGVVLTRRLTRPRWEDR